MLSYAFTCFPTLLHLLALTSRKRSTTLLSSGKPLSAQNVVNHLGGLGSPDHRRPDPELVPDMDSQSETLRGRGGVHSLTRSTKNERARDRPWEFGSKQNDDIGRLHS